MAKTLSFALGFGVMGLEVLLVKSLVQSFNMGFLFIIVSAIFLGGALGAAAVGRFSCCKLLVSKYPFVAMGLSAVFVAGISPYTPAHHDTRMLATLLLIALFASTIWGALQTVLIQESQRPVQLLVASALGTCAGSLLQLALDHQTFEAVRLLFVCALAALILFSLREKSQRALAGCLLAFAAIALSWALEKPPEEGVKVYSNSFATLRVRKVQPGESKGIGRRLKKSEGVLRPGFENIDVYEIIRNGQVATAIVDPTDEKDLEALRIEEPFEMFSLGNKGDIAIIGPGGGQEIMQARLAGYRNITAIEINPLMVQAVANSRAAFPFSYGAGNVNTQIQDGRFFFRHLPPETKFDAITLTNVRSYGTAAALYLSENYLLTADGFANYAAHLKDDGLILFRTNGATEFKRLTHLRSLIAGGLKALATEPVQVFTVRIAKRKSIKLTGHQNGFVAVLHRGRLTSERREGILAGLRSEGVGMIHQYSSLSQMSDSESALSTDDRPFPNALGDRSLVLEFYYLLAVLLIAGIASLRAFGSGRTQQAGIFLAFGFLTGAGYVALQMLVIEKLVFVSGSPALAPIVVIVASCLGSAAAYGFFERVNLIGRSWLGVFAAVAIALVAWSFSAALRLTLSSEAFLAAACVPVSICFALLSLNYLMSFQIVRASKPDWIPYFLAINGFGSLVGGVAGKLVCVEGGMSHLFVISALIYCAVFLLARRKFACDLRLHA